MKSQFRKRWPVIAVAAGLMLTLTLAIAAVSIDLARASAGSDQSLVSEKEQPANSKEKAKMPGGGTLCGKSGTPARQETAKSGRPTSEFLQSEPLPDSNMRRAE